MASRSNKRSRSATCLASLVLLGIAGTTVPVPPAAAGTAGVSLVPDGSAATRVADAAQGEDLYLEVLLNGNDTHRIAHFLRQGDTFRADAATLRKLGFRLPPSMTGKVALTGMPGLGVHYDEAAQQLDITAPPGMLEQNLSVLNTRANPIPHPTASPGLLLNYDFYGARDNHASTSLSLFTELRAFNEWGVLSSTELSRTLGMPGSGTHTDSVRMDTTFSHSWVDSALTLRIGDIISGALGWSRATRLGGIQLQRNFALQPDLVTFPVPAFYGQANLPSTVDLYVNGMKQYSSSVPAGPFQLNTVPVVNGNGQAAVVITDAMGRQTTIAFPFYTTNQLLKPGLSNFSIDAGFVRKNYGLASFDYGSAPAFSGTWRRGFTDWLTLEGHAEATAGLSEGGAGADVAIGKAGVLNASFAASRDRGAGGQQAELGYNWRNLRFNFSIDELRTFGEYRDIASRYSLPPPRRADRALAGIMLDRLGSIGVSYVALQYPGQPRSRYASAYYFKSLGPRIALNLSANQNLDDHRDRSMFLSLSVALDDNVSASLSIQHDRTGNLGTVDASKPVNPDGGFGWNLRAQDGNAQHGGLAELGYNGQDGQILAGVQSLNGDTFGYADLSGALVFMDRQFFLARQVNDAFAVVSTDGVAKVPVLLENRPIGTTNSRGDLLVTPLNAYQPNKLSIDPMKLPADVDIDRVNADVVPADRAGTLVKFGIHPVRAATVILHDGSGKPLAVGSTVTLRGSHAPAEVVGYDGMVYLEDLTTHNTLDARTTHETCTARFDYHPSGNSVPVIGPLVCREIKP
ncbi:MAG: fimbrial biogenesis outer membrane usher protein [Xanthomonadaceae bacterium]|nr:fimbrial biogenesis outer membrane usher protein [Xanthomonadaceae bacterium]